MSSRTDIENTLYRCARGFDEDDIGLMADCFTHDAVLVSSDGTTAGREAIRAAMRARQVFRFDQGQRPRHVLSNVEVEQESETAAGVRSYFTLLIMTPAGATIASRGTYVDTLVKESGQWRISRRQVHVDG